MRIFRPYPHRKLERLLIDRIKSGGLHQAIRRYLRGPTQVPGVKNHFFYTPAGAVHEVEVPVNLPVADSDIHALKLNIAERHLATSAAHQADCGTVSISGIGPFLVRIGDAEVLKYQGRPIRLIPVS